MSQTIRIATSSDAPKWLDLVHATLGSDYAAKEIYNLNWISKQLDNVTGQETWIVEEDGKILCSISFLKPAGPSLIANLGCDLYRPESVNGATQALIAAATKLADQRSQTVVARVSATDNPLQLIYEKLGYTCVGFQPLKHLHREREGILFYIHGDSSAMISRAPISESLPQIGELASAVLHSLNIAKPLRTPDAVSAYPLESSLKIREVSAEEYSLALKNAQSSNPPIEISGRFNHGLGRMRLPGHHPLRMLLALDNNGSVTAGVVFYYDKQDHCARITESFSCDQQSMGKLFTQILSITEGEFGVAYTEVDLLVTAPRLLKSAGQMGFVPVAYFPIFHFLNGILTDVIKMVKLNIPYSIDKSDFTSHSRSIAEIIDRDFKS